MLSQKILKLVRSYVVVNLNTKNYEKALNILRRKNIIIWDINKSRDGIRFNISKKDYEKNNQFFREMNILPQKKIGLAYKLNSLSFRLGIIIGFILVFTYLAIFCSFAWDIKVYGNEKIKAAAIIKLLEDNNISIPIRKSEITKSKAKEISIENLLYEGFNELKFVEIHIEGTKLIIFVKEKKEIEYLAFEDKPTSIIASKQAVIFRTVVKHGELMVKEGDVVNKGQLLVQGTKKISEGEKILVTSDASILGRTYYNVTLSEPDKKIMYKETGKKNTILNLVYKNNKIKLFGNKNKYKAKDSVIRTITIPVISQFFNVSFEKINNFELMAINAEADKQYAENKLKIALYEKLLGLCNKNAIIEKSDIVIEKIDDKYVLNAKIEMIEEIGESIKIYSVGQN